MGGAIFISHNSGSNIPNGTVSGSEQITSLGFISSSDSTTSLNSYTSSTDVRINQLALGNWFLCKWIG